MTSPLTRRDLDLTPKVVVRTCNGVELRDLGHRRASDLGGGGGGATSRDRIGNRLASSSTSSNMIARTTLRCVLSLRLSLCPRCRRPSASRVPLVLPARPCCPSRNCPSFLYLCRHVRGKLVAVPT